MLNLLQNFPFLVNELPDWQTETFLQDLDPVIPQVESQEIITAVSKLSPEEMSNVDQHMSTLAEIEPVLAQMEAGESSDPMTLIINLYYESLFQLYGFLFEALLTGIDIDQLSSPGNDPLITTLTPASDLTYAGFGNFQLPFGRAGNDTIYPFNHQLSSKEATTHIDLLFGDSESITLSILQDTLSILFGAPPTATPPLPPNTEDRFILGDWRTSYYADDNLGYQSFGFLYDFNPEQDIIQLRGKASDYQLLNFPLLGTAIFEKTAESGSAFAQDLVGIIFNPPGNYNIELNAPYLKYVGTTPPLEIVEPKIKQIGSFPVDLASNPKENHSLSKDDPGSALDFGTDITVDPFGNVYSLGITNGVLGNSQVGSYDIWIHKYNNDGALLWKKQFGSDKTDNSIGLTTDDEGNLYVVGSVAGDFITPPQSDGNGDGFIVKFDSEGNQLWADQFGSDYLTSITNVTVDEQGNAYVSGLNVKPDPRPDSDPDKIFPVQDDFFAAKYNSEGNQQWLTTVGSPEETSIALFDEAYEVLLNTDGFLYTGGWTYGDFTGQGNFNAYDIQIAKFDPNTGELLNFSPNSGQRVNQFGTPSFEFPKGLVNDSEGNIYNAGWTFGDLESEGSNLGQEDVWIAKTNLEGNREWIRQFGSAGSDGMLAGGLAIDKDNNLFVAGYTNGQLGDSNFGSFDAWVASYDSDGNQLWLQQFGTSEYDYAMNLAVDKNNNLFVTGFTEGSLGALNAGAVDSWIAKLDATSGEILNFNMDEVADPDTENPVVPANQSFSFTENQNAKLVIGEITANDNLEVTDYAIASGNNNGFFAIDENGVLSLTDAGINGAANDAETDPDVFTLGITASDAAGNTSEPVDVIITVENDPDDDTPAGEEVFRFFNTATGGHFYTASEEERDFVEDTLSQSFELQGTAFLAAQEDDPNATPVFRFFNEAEGEHFYTASKEERDFVKDTLSDFVFEGTAFFAYEESLPETTPVFRFFSEEAGHFYTASAEEGDFVQENLSEFELEGIGFYANPISEAELV